MKKLVIWIFLFQLLALTCDKVEARDIKQSTSANVMVFMTDSTDHVSGKASLTLTITASKDGGAFAAITPTVTERGSGWYNLALMTTDTNTIGDLALHITATGADPADLKHTVVANVEADTYAEMTNAGYGLSKLVRSTTPANTLDVAATGEAGIDLSNVNGTLDAAEIGTGAITNLKFAAGAIDAAAIAADAIGAAEIALDAVGASEIAAGAITSSEFAQSAADLAWSTTARTITGGTITTNNDKTGYSLTTLESAVLHSGTAQAGASGTITLAAGASATTNLYKGLIVKIYGGTGAGQARTITAYDGITKVATVDNTWTMNPDITSIYAILGIQAPKLDGSQQVTAASVQGNVTGSVGSVTGAVGSVTAAVTVGTNNDKTGYALSAAGVDAIWDEAQIGHTTAGTFGKYLDEAISGLDDNPWDNVTRTLTANTNFNDPTAAAIADAVWDEVRTGHTTAGTFGLYLDAQISSVSAPSAATVADAVWDELLSGHLTAGSAGKKLTDLPTSGTGDWTSGEKILIKQALGVNDGDIDAGGDLDAIFLEIKRTRGR